jgi:hypothetical protein
MLLFLIACVFEDDPLPVIPRPDVASAATMSPDDIDEEIGFETVESSEGATATNDAPNVGTVTIEPQPPTAHADLRVSATPTDSDGGFPIVTYEWSVNGTKLLGQGGQTLSHQLFRRGDVVTSCDHRLGRRGILHGDDADHDPERPADDHDAPRVRVRSRRTPDVGQGPDGDRLTWRLEGAPYGMTINPRSGEIAFKGSQVDQGARSLSASSSRTPRAGRPRGGSARK